MSLQPNLPRGTKAALIYYTHLCVTWADWKAQFCRSRRPTVHVAHIHLKKQDCGTRVTGAGKMLLGPAQYYFKVPGGKKRRVGRGRSGQEGRKPLGFQIEGTLHDHLVTWHLGKGS